MCVSVCVCSPVYEGDEGTRYFVYQCVRYAYNPGANRFEEMEIPLPATHDALLADATGKCLSLSFSLCGLACASLQGVIFVA